VEELAHALRADSIEATNLSQRHASQVGLVHVVGALGLLAPVALLVGFRLSAMSEVH
jgi:hypothetical protein